MAFIQLLEHQFQGQPIVGRPRRDDRMGQIQDLFPVVPATKLQRLVRTDQESKRGALVFGPKRSQGVHEVAGTTALQFSLVNFRIGVAGQEGL